MYVRSFARARLAHHPDDLAGYFDALSETSRVGAMSL